MKRVKLPAGAVLPIGLTSFLAAILWGMLGTPAAARPLGKPPGTARSGAVRGGCTTNLLQQPSVLIALMDEEVTQTRKAHPTFLFYIPVGRSERANTALLAIKDEALLLSEGAGDLDEGAIVVSLPDQPGLVSVTVPANTLPLEVGKRYFWAFTILCSRTNPSANLSVSGFLQRVEPPTAVVETPASQSAQPVDRPKFDDNDTWHEWVERLAKMRAMRGRSWNDLLEHFGLEKFAWTPVIELQIREPKASGN